MYLFLFIKESYLILVVSSQILKIAAETIFMHANYCIYFPSRFEDWSSERSLSSERQYPIDDGPQPRKPRPTAGRVLNFGIPSVGDQPRKESGSKKAILDPQGQFLQTWNKIFVLSCVISLALDPLFFYIPVIKIKGDDKCLDADKKLTTIACVLRSLFYTFYVVRIIFQFRTGFISPSSRVFGRGETINDPVAIAKKYLSTYFIIDILSILPLPQVCM